MYKSDNKADFDFNKSKKNQKNNTNNNDNRPKEPNIPRISVEPGVHLVGCRGRSFWNWFTGNCEENISIIIMVQNVEILEKW